MSAPLPLSLSTIPSQSPTTAPGTPDEIATNQESSTKRHSQLMLDQALPTPRLPMSFNAPTQRPISAYFADFSAECGTASPYTKEPVCVLPHLYLGAEHNATDINSLSRLGITAVLNVAVEIATAFQQQQPSSPSRPNGDRIVRTTRDRSIHYKNLSWTHHQRNLQSEFPMAFAFIEETKNMGGKVLVHCQLGVSRSASLVIAYVMKTLQMNLTDAYEFVKTRSSVISPNMSLMYQLAEFGKSLTKPSTNARPAILVRTGSKNNFGAEDDEDIYPYPAERMDIDSDTIEYADNKENRKPAPFMLSAVKMSPLANSRTTKRSNLVLTRSNSRSGAMPSMEPVTPSVPVNTTTATLPTYGLSSRSRAPYHRSSLAPMTTEPLNLMAPSSLETPAEDSSSFSQYSLPPSTPMADRFSFPDSNSIPPSTPLTDRFSFQIFPEGVSQASRRPSYSNRVVPSTPLTQSFDLSPPVPPFVASHRPMSSATSSISSFASSATFSRPSSTSSSASSSGSIPVSAPISTCGSPVTVSPIATSTTPAASASKESRSRRSSGIWSKMPSTPIRSISFGPILSSLSSSSSAATASGQQQQAGPTKKPAAIHAFAKALTRRWSSGLLGFQEQQQQQQNAIECLMTDSTLTTSPEEDVTMCASVREAAEGNENDGCSASTSPEFVFSPRACSPIVQETKSFGEVYHVLRMEG
ncbi:Dual specificity protein phosphatase 1 [Dissophora globulifera]|nr:Dual specificity protein phosphatase 1 [Dissophora globulifera]